MQVWIPNNFFFLTLVTLKFVLTNFLVIDGFINSHNFIMKLNSKEESTLFIYFIQKLINSIYMDPQAFAPPPPSPFLMSNVTSTGLLFLSSLAIVAFCIVCTFIIALIDTTVGMLLSWLLFGVRDRHMNDLEAAQEAPGNNVTTFFQILLVELFNGVREEDIEEELVELFNGVREEEIEEEGEEQRLQALELLPPPINYKNLDASSSLRDCAICLEDFVDGESCRVFSVCKHIFHLDCVDKWLRNNPTCPICRNYVIDV